MPLLLDRGRSIDEGRPSENRWLGELKLVGQTESEWCWAACAEMIVRFYGESKAQCEVAQSWLESVHGGSFSSNCCHDGDACNDPIEDVESVTRLFRDLGFPNTEFFGPDIDRLFRELNQGRPALLGFRVVSSLGHLALAVGWGEDGFDRYVDIYDPLPQPTGSWLQRYCCDLATVDDHRQWSGTWTIGRR